MQVRPGYFKYGWSAPIQRYAHSEQETRHVAETAAAAAARALEVIPLSTIPAVCTRPRLQSVREQLISAGDDAL